MDQKQRAENYEKDINAQLSVLMKQLATPAAFLKYYFRILPKCKSQKAAFDIVNLLYLMVFDEEKYASYNSFRQAKNAHFKK